MQRYDDYKIEYKFLGGNICSESNLDVPESCYRYAAQCRRALEAEYPGATIEVDYEANASGGGGKEVRVTTPDGMDDFYHVISDGVYEITGRVWESWEWASYKESPEEFGAEEEE